MRFYVMFLLLLGIHAAFGETVYSQLQQSGVRESSDPAIPILYSNGYKQQATQLSELLGPSAGFFKSRLNVELDVKLAVLNKTDWQEVSKVPYGLPFVSGPPYVIGIPATTDHPLAQTLHAALAEKDLKPLDMTRDEMVRLFISLIGFHELGHIYAKSAGIHLPNKWIDEFVATYLAYSYLAATESVGKQVWLRGAEALVRFIQPSKTTLADFESLYYRVGIENYAWYQAVFLKRTDALYSASGFEFIQTLQDNPLPGSLAHFGLSELESRFPGFETWAKRHKLVEPK